MICAFHHPLYAQLIHSFQGNIAHIMDAECKTQTAAVHTQVIVGPLNGGACIYFQPICPQEGELLAAAWGRDVNN